MPTVEHHRLPATPGGRAKVLPADREEARIRTAEGLDRRVWISDEDDPCAAARDDSKQPGCCGGHLLGIVDDDEAQALMQARECRGDVLEHIGGRGEHPGGVIGPVPAQRGHLVVLAQDPRGGDPLGSVVLATEAVQVLRTLAVLDSTHEEVAQLVAEAACGERVPDGGRPLRGRGVSRRVSGEEVAENRVLLGAVEQPRRWVTA